MFNPVNPKTSFPEIEQKMQSWHNEKIKISKNIEIPFFRE
jgi:hypothetical protein